MTIRRLTRAELNGDGDLLEFVSDFQQRVESGEIVGLALVGVNGDGDLISGYAGMPRHIMSLLGELDSLKLRLQIDHVEGIAEAVHDKLSD